MNRATAAGRHHHEGPSSTVARTGTDLVAERDRFHDYDRHPEGPKALPRRQVVTPEPDAVADECGDALRALRELVTGDAGPGGEPRGGVGAGPLPGDPPKDLPTARSRRTE